jgi:hypothetical protein
MMQDTLRGPLLASLPFYDQKKVVALLDQLPAMADSERMGWDPVLMSVLSACVVQERFGLGSKVAGNDSFASGSHPVMGILRERVRSTRRLERARCRVALTQSPNLKPQISQISQIVG